MQERGFDRGVFYPNFEAIYKAHVALVCVLAGPTGTASRRLTT